MEKAERGKLERSPWKDRRNHDRFPAPSHSCLGTCLRRPLRFGRISLEPHPAVAQEQPACFPDDQSRPERQRVEPPWNFPGSNGRPPRDPDCGRTGGRRDLPRRVRNRRGFERVQISHARRRRRCCRGRAQIGSGHRSPFEKRLFACCALTRDDLHDRDSSCVLPRPSDCWVFRFDRSCRICRTNGPFEADQ